MKREVEIKIATPSAASARALLRRNGFRLDKRRVFESNVLYDTADQALRTRSQLLRLRRAGAKAVLTYKGAPEEGPHKSREELEFSIGSAETAASVFERLGLKPYFRYEKYRTEYRRAREPGHVTVDETPIGVHLELEGPPAWIDRTARRLGFGREDYITASYGALYLQACAARGLPPGDMVFT